MKLAILIREHGTLYGTAERYYMADVVRLLEQEGAHVVVVSGMPRHCDESIAADAAVLHVDLTVVPDEYREFMKRYPVVLNGALMDIAKRRFSASLLNAGDAYTGPVIVKSNRNYAGKIEAALSRRGLHPPCREHRYEILQSIGEVPAEVWSDPDRVVEKFLPEIVEPGVYCLRMWKFLGGAETNTLAYSREPIVKGANVFMREEIGTVPDELREIRKALGVDFGKLDYAIVDGRPVLYDVNRTPTRTRPLDEEMHRIRAFADALKGYLQ